MVYSAASAAPARTKNSIVFGVPVRHITKTRPPFRWNEGQVEIYEEFVRLTYPDHESADRINLLAALNLDGYEDIVTDNGENAQKLILVQVDRKLQDVAQQHVTNLSMTPNIKPFVEDTPVLLPQRSTMSTLATPRVNMVSMPAGARIEFSRDVPASWPSSPTPQRMTTRDQTSHPEARIASGPSSRIRSSEDETRMVRIIRHQHMNKLAADLPEEIKAAILAKHTSKQDSVLSRMEEQGRAMVKLANQLWYLQD